jgi:hypothetical protein
MRGLIYAACTLAPVAQPSRDANMARHNMVRHNWFATTCTVARARGFSFHVTRGEKNLLWKFVRDSLTSQSNGATSRPAMLVRIVLPYASARAEAPLLLLVCVCVCVRSRVRACGGGGLCYSQELSSGGADALRSFAFAAIAATRGCALWLPPGHTTPMLPVCARCRGVAPQRGFDGNEWADNRLAGGGDLRWVGKVRWCAGPRRCSGSSFRS